MVTEFQLGSVIIRDGDENGIIYYHTDPDKYFDESGQEISLTEAELRVREESGFLMLDSIVVEDAIAGLQKLDESKNTQDPEKARLLFLQGMEFLGKANVKLVDDWETRAISNYRHVFSTVGGMRSDMEVQLQMGRTQIPEKNPTSAPDTGGIMGFMNSRLEGSLSTGTRVGGGGRGGGAGWAAAVAGVVLGGVMLWKAFKKPDPDVMVPELLPELVPDLEIEVDGGDVGREVEEEGEEGFLWEIDVVAQSQDDDDSPAVDGDGDGVVPGGGETEPEGDAERADELIEEAVSSDRSVAHLFQRDPSPAIAQAAQAVISEARASGDIDPVFDGPSFDREKRDEAAEKLALAAQIYEELGELDRAAVLYERVLRLAPKQQLHYLLQLHEIYIQLNRPTQVLRIEKLIKAHYPDAYVTLVLGAVNVSYDRALKAEDHLLRQLTLIEYDRLLSYLKEHTGIVGGFTRLIDALHEREIYDLESHAREAFSEWQSETPGLITTGFAFENHLLAIEAAYRSGDMGRVAELLDNSWTLVSPMGEERFLVDIANEMKRRWSRELPALRVLTDSYWSGSLDGDHVGNGE